MSLLILPQEPETLTLNASMIKHYVSHLTIAMLEAHCEFKANTRSTDAFNAKAIYTETDRYNDIMHWFGERLVDIVQKGGMASDWAGGFAKMLGSFKKSLNSSESMELRGPEELMRSNDLLSWQFENDLSTEKPASHVTTLQQIEQVNRLFRNMIEIYGFTKDRQEQAMNQHLLAQFDQALQRAKERLIKQAYPHVTGPILVH